MELDRYDMAAICPIGLGDLYRVSRVRPDRVNVLLAKHSHSMINAANLLPSGDAIERVIGVVAGVKVLRVAAGLIVTTVQNIRPCWNRSFVQLEGEAVRAIEFLAVAAKHAIAAAYRGFPSPRPAVVGATDVDVTPEALYYCASFPAHMLR